MSAHVRVAASRYVYTVGHAIAATLIRPDAGTATVAGQARRYAFAVGLAGWRRFPRA